jgi:hypothetical protein
MSDSLISFEWTVASAYRVVTWQPRPDPPGITTTPRWDMYPRSGMARPPKQWPLLDGVIVPTETSSQGTAYQPFSRQYSALYREFARLDGSEAGLAAFAQKYGLLGVPETVTHPTTGETFLGERLTQWEWEHRLLCAVVELCDQERRGLLKRTADWRTLFAYWRVPDGQWRSLNGAARSRLLIQTAVDSGLKQRVAPDFRLAVNGQFQLVFGPRSLLGAMWLQLAMALSHPTDYRNCKFCGRQLAISKGNGFRINREFCSGACKTRDSRGKKKALALVSRGLSARQISKKIGTTEDNVRRWLTDRKRRRQ